MRVIEGKLDTVKMIYASFFRQTRSLILAGMPNIILFSYIYKFVIWVERISYSARLNWLRSIGYNFTEVQVSRVIIVLLLQNCFVWCKDHTHQAILTTELLELEGWQLNAKI